MNVNEARATQEEHVLEVLRSTASKWYHDKLKTKTVGLTEEELNSAAKYFVDEDDDGFIAHHATKVMDNGCNQGRLDARCIYLQSDLNEQLACDDFLTPYFEERWGKSALLVAA
jgi:hypothetical protein